MSAAWEVDFADDCGRYFARMHGLAPMTGRVLGWLIACESADQTIAEIAEALHASRSAAAGAVAQLEGWAWVHRSRTAGERVDRVRLAPDLWTLLIDNPAEYQALGAIARSGLQHLSRRSVRRADRLRELADFTDFVASRMPALAAEWRAHVAATRGHVRSR